MRNWLIVGLMVSVALGGCTEEPIEDVQDDPTTDPQDPTTAGNNNTPGGGDPPDASNGTHAPPTANLTADVLNGTAPLLVNFTLNGTANGNLSWVLAVNGTEVANGTALPATVAHNFTDAGNFTAVLTVSDGNASSQAGLTIDVLGPAVEAGPSLQATWKGTIEEPTCIFQDGHGVTQDQWGMEYRVVAGWADGMFMDFWDAGTNNQVATSDTPTGTIPDGTATAWLCMGDSLTLLDEYTIEVWA